MKIDKKLIEELTKYLDEFNLTEIEYQEGTKKIKVGKGSVSTNIVTAHKPGIAKKVEEDNGGNKITSPIIGTAYLAPEPGGKKFVEIGKKINKGDTIMIVEAMKTMNHIPSPISGIVKKICVKDGEPVEYGHTIAIIE